MSSRSLLALACLACLGALGWLLFGQSDPSLAGGSLSGAERAAPAAPEAPTALESSGLAAVEPAGPTASRVSAAEALPAVAAGAHPWAGQLAGVTGRIVEQDGTPVPDMRVELLQVDVTSVFAAEGRALGNPSIELAETRTDDEGRFLLDGATLGSFHGLGLDRGGPRSTLRLVEEALEHGAQTDLGDIVLDAFGVLLGTVLDEDGEPVVGARVRVAPVPEIVVQSGVLDLRADSSVAFEDGGQRRALDLPRVAADQLDLLPIPTTYTATDGTFRLEGVPLATIVGGVDHPGYVATLIPTMTMEPGETDLGELDLEYGRALAGRVLDAAGKPVEGAEVIAGAFHTMAPVGVMQPAGRTGPDGAFRVVGIPELGTPVAFARRSTWDDWTAAKPEGAETALEVVLDATARLTVNARDAAGDPIEGADVRLTFRGDESRPEELALLLNLPMNERSGAVLRPTEVEPGTYVEDGVTVGKWRVEVHGSGLAPAFASVDLGAGGAEVAVVCQVGQRYRVRVTDAASGEPVARAFTSLIGPQGFLFGAVASEWSDAGGEVELGPMAPVASLPDTPFRRELKSYLLRVQHPRYGEVTLDLPEGLEVVEVQLPPACTLTGRIHWGGGVPDRPYTIFLERRDVDGFAEAFALPRPALSGLEGQFRVTGLAPGNYRVNVFERFFDRSPMELLIEQQEPVMRAREDVTVQPGDPTHVEIDLSPSGLGPTCRFAGSVAVSGVPVRGAKVSLRGAETIELETDSQGNFETDDVSALRGYWVEIEGEVALPDGSQEKRTLYEEWLQPEPNSVERIDVALQFGEVTVEVVDQATGAAVAGASVVAQQNGAQSQKTGPDGRVTILVSDEHGVALEISGAGYASMSAFVDGDSVAQGSVTRVEVVRPVPCAGRVVPGPGAVLPAASWRYLSINATEGGGNHGLQLEGEEWTFSFDGVAPGRYSAQIWSSDGTSELYEFDLDPAGSTTLEIQFVPQGEEF